MGKKIVRENGKVIYLETSVDKLLDLVKKEKVIKFSDAAKKLNVNEKQIEEWGKILEDHKLIELDYPVVGKPVLIFREKSVKKIKEKKKPSKKGFIITLIIGLLVLFLIVFKQRFTQFTLNLNLTNLITIIQNYLIFIMATIILVMVLIILKKKWTEIKLWFKLRL